MAAERASANGVKSLRAMFENTNSPSDPESRGRTSSTPGTGENVRPLSKVRTAFVPVEPNAQLAKKMNDTTSEARNGTRGSSDSGSVSNGTTTDSGLDTSNDSVKSPEVRKLSSASTGNGMSPGRVRAKAQPASPKNTSAPDQVLKNLATTLKTPSKSGLRQAASPAQSASNDNVPSQSAAMETTKSSAQTNGKLVPTLPASTSKPASINVETSKAAPNPSLKTQSPPSQPQTPSRSAPKTTVTKTRAAHEPSRDTNKPSSSRPAANNTSKTTASKPQTAKNPSKPQNEGTRSSTSFVKPRPRSPTRPINLPAHLVAPTTSSASKLRSEAAAAEAAKAATAQRRPKQQPETTHSTSFVKPRPKSPTRPITLPVHLVAPTASSAAKLRSEAAAAEAAEAAAAQRQPRREAEGKRSSTGFVKPRPKSPTRPIILSSHLVAPTASSAAKLRSEAAAAEAAATATAGSRSRRTSNISSTSSHPSSAHAYKPMVRKASATFGPPPKKNGQDPDKTQRRVSRAPDDGFLARMMRPTTSSASKVHESPPRVRATGAPAAKAQVPIKARSLHNLKNDRSIRHAPRPGSVAGHGKPKAEDLEEVPERLPQTPELAVEEPEHHEQSVESPGLGDQELSLESAKEDGVPEAPKEDISESAATLVPESVEEKKVGRLSEKATTAPTETETPQEADAS